MKFLSDSPAKPPAAFRDPRIDFWRGVCLIDMVLVHLVYQGMHFGDPLQGILGEYTRFAAGGFIFTAGLAIGAIFLPRARDPERRWATYRALWRRALFILGVHYAAEISFLIMFPLFGAGAFEHPVRQVVDVLLLRSGHDLLPFYVIMIAACPLVLELMRRGLMWVVASGSVLLFFFSRHDPYALSFFPIQYTFPPALWQIIFVGGVCFGAVLYGRYDRLAALPKRALALTTVAATALLFLFCYGADFGIHINPGLNFWKVPLTGGEAMRYFGYTLTLILVTDQLLFRAARGAVPAAPIRALAMLGRHSLPVYVAHVWVVQVAVQTAGRMRWQGPELLIVAAACLAMLFAFGAYLDGKPFPRLKNPYAVFPRLALAGAGAAAILLGLNAYIGTPAPLNADETTFIAAADADDGIPSLDDVNQTQYDPFDDTPMDVIDTANMSNL